jgi:predicted transcriptional regulator
MLLEQKKKIIRDEKWQELVEEYKKCKLSKYEFCKIKNVPRSTFYKWSKIFAENDKNAAKSKFIPVKMEDWEEARAEEIKSELIIESKSGLRIEFRNGWKIEEIGVIVGILG